MENSTQVLLSAGGAMTSETEEVLVQHMPSPQRKAGGAENLKDFL